MQSIAGICYTQASRCHGTGAHVRLYLSLGKQLLTQRERRTSAGALSKCAVVITEKSLMGCECDSKIIITEKHLVVFPLAVCEHDSLIYL